MNYSDVNQILRALDRIGDALETIAAAGDEQKLAEIEEGKQQRAALRQW